MSIEFESLRRTSILPDGLAEGDLQDYWLVEFGGTHGDERPALERVLQHQQGISRPPEVLPIIANRAAAEAGKRCIQSPQLMARYPGSFDSRELEDRTAAGLTWLSRQLPDNHVVLDWHNGVNGPDFIACGRQASAAGLALGHMLTGSNDVRPAGWTRFFQAIPGAVALEQKFPDTDDDETARRRFIDGVLAQAVELGPEGLKDAYHKDIAGELRFTELVRELLLHDPGSGQPNADVLSVLPELEALDIPTDEAPVRFSRRIIDALGLRDDVQYIVRGGHYNNLSLPVDNARLGLPDDRQRRLGWGVLYASAQPPEPQADGATLRFNGLQG